MKIEIIDNSINIKNYPFYSIFKRKIQIVAWQIDYVNLNSDPIFIYINSNEIIFLSRDYKEEINSFIINNNVKVLNNKDVWELICYPMVDEYISNETLDENEKMLLELSFYKDEVVKIRKKNIFFFKVLDIFNNGKYFT